MRTKCVTFIGLEPLPTRYTQEWEQHLVTQAKAAAQLLGSSAEIRYIGGEHAPHNPTNGGFLNFAATNRFKAQQVWQLVDLIERNDVQPGDIFVFTDAWHFGVVALAYMSDLLDRGARIVLLWHAGHYDPHDLLAQKGRRGFRHFERALYEIADLNCFATNSHIKQFRDGHGVDRDRILQTGWPMSYLPETLAPYAVWPKRDLVLFPHRISDEKQPEIFRDLAEAIDGYEFKLCQETSLTKHQYHTLLGQAKLVFSASLQETLGIGMYEGLLCGAVPFAPTRLSYNELYPGEYLYPEHWTASWDAYRLHKPALVDQLKSALANAPKTRDEAEVRFAAARKQADPYFDADKLFQAIFT